MYLHCNGQLINTHLSVQSQTWVGCTSKMSR